MERLAHKARSVGFRVADVLDGGRLTPCRCRPCDARCVALSAALRWASSHHHDTNGSSAPRPKPTSPAEDACWSCGSCVNKAKLVCGSCSHIQPVDGSANYFQMLDLPQRYEISSAQLDGQLKKLQKVVHPDLYTRKSTQEQELSASASAKLNVAYKMLRDPTTRAQYLLQLHGVDAIGESVGTAGVSPELLMQVMEAREVLEEPDVTQEEVRALKARNDAAIDACVRDITAAFDASLRPDLARAKAITVALQYYTRLRYEISEWLHNKEAHGS